MSDKELLYIQDALGHVNHFKKLCDECQTAVTDSGLKQFISAIKEEYQQVYTSIYSLLGTYGG